MNIETIISEYGDHITHAQYHWDTLLKEFANVGEKANQRVNEAFRTLTLSAMRAHHQIGQVHTTTLTREEADYWGLPCSGTQTTCPPACNPNCAGKGAPNAPIKVTATDSPGFNTIGNERANSNNTNSLAFGTPIILIRLALALINTATFLLRHDTETNTRLKRISQEIKAKTTGATTPATASQNSNQHPLL